MKKRNWSFFCALVGLALLLTACAAPVQGEGRLLEFPKTSWEMTPEEVMAAYGVSQDAVLPLSLSSWNASARPPATLYSPSRRTTPASCVW